ncbi:MAG: NUDIX domain-containing protein, partial [Acidimicrobiales bacterium]
MSDRDAVGLRCSAIVLRDDAVLLCRRVSSPGHWVLPGGTPHRREGAAAAVQREVAEETGLAVSAERVAFVLEVTGHDPVSESIEHLVEIVFYATMRDLSASPAQLEPELEPQFVRLSDLAGITLLPPVGGYIRSLAPPGRRWLGAPPGTAPYLGNAWRALDGADAV